MNFELIVMTVLALIGVGLYARYRHLKYVAKKKAYEVEKFKVNLHLDDLLKRGTIHEKEYKRLLAHFENRLNELDPDLKRKLGAGRSDNSKKTPKSK